MLTLVFLAVAGASAVGGAAVGSLLRGGFKPAPQPRCTSKDRQHTWGPWSFLNEGGSVYRPDQARECLACGLRETVREVPDLLR